MVLKLSWKFKWPVRHILWYTQVQGSTDRTSDRFVFVVFRAYEELTHTLSTKIQ